MKHYKDAVKAFGENCKDDVSQASQELKLQAKEFLVIAVAVPLPTEEASDAVGHLPRAPEAGTQCVVVEAAQTCQIQLCCRRSTSSSLWSERHRGVGQRNVNSYLKSSDQL